ncbi:MAG: acyl carrier protein [Pseudomonadota bacterium]
MTDKRKANIRKKLNDIFCDVFDDDDIEITEEMTAEDIDEWDSLMQVTLIVSIEKEFDIQLNAAEISQLENIGGMLSILEERT